MRNVYWCIFTIIAIAVSAQFGYQTGVMEVIDGCVKTNGFEFFDVQFDCRMVIEPDKPNEPPI